MISIYELLQLIKNGTQPNKIKYCGRIYEWDNTFLTYITEKDNIMVCLGGTDNEINMFVNAFNKNVEVIPETEEKEIKKIDLGILNSQSEKNREFRRAINELIDEIENLKKEGK